MKKATKTAGKTQLTTKETDEKELLQRLLALPWVSTATKRNAYRKHDGWEITTRPGTLSIVVRHKRKAITVPLLPMRIAFQKSYRTPYVATISVIDPPDFTYWITPQAGVSQAREEGTVSYCTGDMSGVFMTCTDVVQKAVLLAEFIQTAHRYDGGECLLRYAETNNLLPTSKHK